MDGWDIASEELHNDDGWGVVSEKTIPAKPDKWNEQVKPSLIATGKALLDVPIHMAASMAQMPISGLAAAAKLISTRGDFNAANKVLEENQQVLNKAYLGTPEERKASENLNLAMKPFEMAGKGLAEIGKATGIPYAEPILGTVGEAAAMFGLPGAAKGLRGVKGIIRRGEKPITKSQGFYEYNPEQIAKEKIPPIPEIVEPGAEVEAKPPIEPIEEKINPKVQKSLQQPVTIPEAAAVQIKTATKDTLAEHHANGQIEEGTPIRLTSVDELRKILKTGKLQIGSDFEGRPGISAQGMNKDVPVVAYGPNNKISAAIIFPKEAIEGKGMQPNEYLMRPETDINELRFVIDGHKELLTLEDLRGIYEGETALQKGKELPAQGEQSQWEIVDSKANLEGKQPWEMTRKEFQADLRYLGPESVIKGERPAGVASPVQLEEIKEAKQLGLETVELPDGSIVYGKTLADAEALKEDLLSGMKDPEKSIRLGYTDVDRSALEKYGYKAHKSAIEQALSEGKPVPAEVLKDYPGLAEGKPSAGNVNIVKQDLSDFVDSSISKPEKQGVIQIRPVNSKEAGIIWGLINENVKNAKHEISADDVRHMLKQHGDPKKESARGQIAITPKDIKRIPDIIDRYDAIESGSVDRNGRKSIRYIKTDNGTTTYVEVLVKKAGVLSGKTMWKTPSGRVNAIRPDHTSKTATGPGAPDHNLTPSPENVKSEVKPVSKVRGKSVAAQMVEANPIYQMVQLMKNQGGISIKSMKDYDIDTVKELMKRFPGLLRKEGIAFDVQAADMGLDEATLMDQLLNLKTKKETNKELSAIQNEEFELAKKGFTKTPNGTVAGDLKPGDRVFMDDDTYKVAHDKKGNIILKDGKTIKADVFEKIPTEGIKKAIPKGEFKNAEIPGASERETFGLANPETEWGELKGKGNIAPTQEIFGKVAGPTITVDKFIRDRLESDVAYWKSGRGSKLPAAEERLADTTKTLNNFIRGKLSKDDQRYIEGLKGEFYEKQLKEGKEIKTAQPEKNIKDIGFQPAEGFERRIPENDLESTKPVKRSDIVKFLQEKFDVPLRVGRFRVPNALGIFKVKPEVIRTRMANDIEVISHEIGHGLNKYMWGMDKQYLNVKPLKPFETELLPIATKARGKQPPIQEGFAEFIRLYVTNETKARNQAPKFYEFFEKELSDKLPEAQNILLDARDQFNKWAKQPYTQRLLGQLSIGEKEHKTYGLKEAYTQWVDDLHPLKKAVEEISRDLDKPLEASKDPYKLARLMPGWTGKATAFLEHKTFDFKTYADKGKSFKDIMKPVDDLDSFRAYISAERALELNKRGIETGILKEDALKVVSEQQGKYKAIFDELKQYQDDCLVYLRDSGILNMKDYVKIKLLNREYVPFYRIMESAKGGGTGKGLEAMKPVKGIKGSWRDIVDPLESIVKNTYTFIQAAEKNTVLRSLVDLANRQEGMGKFVERIPTPMQKITIKEPELLGILQKYGKWTETTKYKETQRTVGEKIRNIGTMGEEITGGATRSAELMEQQAMEALRARGRTEGEARIILDKIKKAPTAEIKTKIIEREIEKISVRETVKEFGLELPNEMVDIFRPSAFTPKDDVITVWKNGKKEFYQLDPDLAKTIQALDKESTHTLIKLLSYPARWLRAGATLTPEFILRNPLRDQFSAFVYSKYGFVPGYDLVRGIFHMVKADEVYWNWKKSGGEHSMLVSMDREYLQKGLDQVLAEKNVSNIAKTIVKNPLRALQILSELTETGTRIGEFSRAIKEGGTGKGSLLEGGFSSREVTLDFHRKGTAGKAFNQITAFWNANIQGQDKMVRSFIEKAVPTTIKVSAAITLPSVLLYMVNRDDPRWKEVPQWQKDLFWIVMTEDHIWRIPKPFELGILFGSCPERILEYIDNKNPRLFKSLASSIISGASPSFIPTALTPLLENWANKSFFMDRPIVSSSREKVKPAYQYQPYTTELAKSLGKALDQVSGGMMGSPAKIENLVRGWSGGIGTYALNIADYGLRKAGILPDKVVPTKTPADYPLLKAFTVRYPSSDSESIKEFYENYEKYSQIKATATQLEKKEYKPQEARELRASEHHFKMDNYYRAMSKQQRFIQKVYANPNINPEDKRRLIDNAYMHMISTAQRANEHYSRHRRKLAS